MALAIVFLVVLPLLVAGAYYAGRLFHPEEPFHYRLSPFHGLALLVPLLLVFWHLPQNGADKDALLFFIPFLLLPVLVLLLFDLALQWIIRNREKLYWTESIVSLCILARLMPELL